MKADIVLGLGYGDEGKGITTDYLCSQSYNPVVIRFSGGQQAGHTVIKDGVKHIHANFGAGSLRGIPTYFTEHTTVYPNTIYSELEVLQSHGLNPILTIHPLANLTTPFDVHANRLCTTNNQHGTCGLGVGKTMKRNLESPYKLYAVDLLHPKTLIQKLSSIGAMYYKNMDLDSSALQTDIDNFIVAIQSIEWDIKNYDYLTDFQNLIFEGSQGIQLDMNHGVFPNVTYASTTSKNAHYVLDKLDVLSRNVYYVTRAYATRHGNGPFKEAELNLVNNQEEINHLNDWQGQFKVGHIDYDLLNQSLAIDDIYCTPATTNAWVTKNLVVTCCDQISDKFDYDKVTTGFKGVFESYSPESVGLLDLKNTNNNIVI